MGRSKAKSPRGVARPMTMTPHEVLKKLNDHHRAVIFPRIFDKLTFDMISEVEYHFVLDKVRDNKRLRVTKSEFWMSSDRAPSGNFKIEFDADDGRFMGRWLHNVVDPKTMCAKHPSGKIGFTMNHDKALDAAKHHKVLAITEAFRNDM